jgi:hypothetical protein
MLKLKQMKIKNKLIDLKGKEVELTIGEAIANILINDDKGGKMKLYVLATKFTQQDNIELDKADLAMVKTAVETSKIYNALVIGQLLVLLEKTDDSKEEPKSE